MAEFSLGAPVKEPSFSLGEKVSDSSILNKVKDIGTEVGKVGLGTLETLMNTNSGLAASGLALPLKYKLMVYDGLSGEQAKERSEQFADALTYKPMTEAGQTGARFTGQVMGDINSIIRDMSGSIKKGPIKHISPDVIPTISEDALMLYGFGKAGGAVSKLEAIRAARKLPPTSSVIEPPITETSPITEGVKTAPIKEAEVPIGTQGDLFGYTGKPKYEQPIVEKPGRPGPLNKKQQGEFNFSLGEPVQDSVKILPNGPSAVQDSVKVLPNGPPLEGDSVYYKGQYREVTGVGTDGSISLDGLDKPISGKGIQKASPEESSLVSAGFSPSEIHKMTPEKRLEILNDIKRNQEAPITPEQQIKLEEADGKIKAALLDKDLILLKENGIPQEQLEMLSDRKIRELARDIRNNIETPSEEGTLMLERAKQTLEEAQRQIEKEGKLDDAYESEISKAITDAELAFDPATYDPIRDLEGSVTERMDRKNTAKAPDQSTMETGKKPTSQADWEALLEKEGMPAEPTGRGVGDFLSDVSDVIGGADPNTLGMNIGQYGYETFLKKLILGKDLTSMQQAARARIMQDLEKFKLDAYKTGRSLAETMMRAGVPLWGQKPFLGPFDKMWRIELDDSKANFVSNPNSAYHKTWHGLVGEGKLKDIYDHPTLYDFYPDLADLKVIKERIKGGAVGAYNPITDTIRISSLLNDSQALKTLRHEITHAIQMREVFAQGGGVSWQLLVDSVPSLMKMYERVLSSETSPVRVEYIKELRKSLNDFIHRDYTEIENLSIDAKNLYEKASNNTASASELNQLQNNSSLLMQYKSKYSELLEHAYLSIAGEIEARTVANRGHLSNEERIASPPKWDGFLPGEAKVHFGPTDYSFSKSSDILNKLGLGETYDKVTAALKNRKAEEANPGNTILKEVQGSEGTQRVNALKANKKEPIFLSEWFRTPMKLFEKTTPEAADYVYRLIKGTMLSSHNHYVNSTGIRKIFMDIKKEGISPEDFTSMLRGKATPTSEAAVKAMGDVRTFFDSMKANYKNYLKNKYKEGLSPEEVTALDHLTSIQNGNDLNGYINAYSKKGLNGAVLRDIVNKYKEIDQWGLDDYITKMELGNIKILDEKKQILKIAFSKSDAIRKATAYLQENPDVKNLYIDTSFKDILGDLTEIKSTKQYFAILNSLKKSLQAEVEGISKGTAAHFAKNAAGRTFIIKPSEVFAPMLETRRNVLEGSENIFPVLYAYSRIMEKKMALDPLILEGRKVMQDLTNKGYNKAPGMLQRLIEDAKGSKSSLDVLVDDLFSSATDTIRENTGLNIDIKPYAASRFLTMGRQAQAQLKLGWRPMNGVINFLSGNMHTLAKTSALKMAEAVKFMSSEEGKAFLHEVEPYLGQNFVEESTGKFSAFKADTGVGKAVELVKPLGAFQLAELPNRLECVSANYLKYLKEGMTPEAAREAAIRANWFQQFVYNTANLPRSMRGPVGRTLMQFKPYLIQELEFLSSLSAGEAAKYISGMVALGGPRGIMMIIKSLPLLTLIPGFTEMMEDVEKYGNRTMPRAFRGVVGGLTGTDISAPTTFQIPNEPMDFAGPMISDAYSIYKDLIVKKAEGKEIGKADISKMAGSIAPFWKHWRTLLAQNITEDGWVLDENNRRAYQLYDNSKPGAKVENVLSHSLKRVAGAEPIEASMEKVENRLEALRGGREKWNKTSLATSYIDYIKKGEPVPQSLIDKMNKEGAWSSLESALMSYTTSPILRRAIRADIRSKGDVLEYQPLPKDSLFSDETSPRRR